MTSFVWHPELRMLGQYDLDSSGLFTIVQSGSEGDFYLPLGKCFPVASRGTRIPSPVFLEPGLCIASLANAMLMGACDWLQQRCPMARIVSWPGLGDMLSSSQELVFPFSRLMSLPKSELFCGLPVDLAQRTLLSPAFVLHFLPHTASYRYTVFSRAFLVAQRSQTVLWHQGGARKPSWNLRTAHAGCAFRSSGFPGMELQRSLG